MMRFKRVCMFLALLGMANLFSQKSPLLEKGSVGVLNTTTILGTADPMEREGSIINDSTHLPAPLFSYNYSMSLPHLGVPNKQLEELLEVPSLMYKKAQALVHAQPTTPFAQEAISAATSSRSEIKETLKTVLPYDSKRDREFIRASFVQDWFWLTMGFSASFDPAYYDVDYLLDTGRYASNRNNPVEVMIRTVLDSTGIPQGFIVYFLDDEKTGRILFLSVSESKRNAGAATALMKYALNHFKELGIEKVFLFAHYKNYTALRLYKKLGFVEDSHEYPSVKLSASLVEQHPVHL